MTHNRNVIIGDGLWRVIERPAFSGKSPNLCEISIKKVQKYTMSSNKFALTPQ